MSGIEQSGFSTGEALRALDRNFAAHASWIAARLAGARVRDEPSYLIVDSGLPTDTFNLVCRARIAPRAARERIARALDCFRDVGRPFSWWVGPLDEPADLGARLSAAGLAADEPEVAMAAPLAGLAAAPAPDGLRVARVRTAGQLADFARVVAANWDPPDPHVASFYERAEAILGPAAPIRLYVGYVGDEAVATSELCLAAGAAGIYGVATLRAHRRKGYGTALARAPLLDARREGVRLGVLQASADGLDVYRRLGFEAVGDYTEYKPVRGAGG